MRRAVRPVVRPGRRAAVLACALLLAGASAEGQGPVSSIVAGQRDEPDHPAVAARSNGQFAVAWAERSVAQGRPRVVVLGFEDGEHPWPAGEVEIPAEGEVRQVELAAQANAWVIAWKDEEGIRAQRLSTAGLPLTPVFPLTDERSGGFAVAANPASRSGRFVAVWESIPLPCSGLAVGCEGPELRGRMFDGQGMPQCKGPRTLDSKLDGGIAGDPVPPRVVRTEGSGFALSWQKGGVAGDVYLATLDWPWGACPEAPDHLGGSPFNLVTPGLQLRPALAASSIRNLRVAWASGPLQVPIDLVLCLSRGSNTRSDRWSQGSDTLSLQLGGIATVLADRRVLPLDGMLRMGLLGFGSDAILSLPREEAPPALLSMTSDSAQDLSAGLAGLELTRSGQGTSAARCLCAATKLLTGADPCPQSTADLCALPPMGAVPGPRDGRRKLVLLATGSLPTRLSPPFSPFVFAPNTEEVSCELRGASLRARRSGVAVIDAVRLPDSGFERELLAAWDLPEESVPRIDLETALLAGGRPGSQGEVVAVDDGDGFARTLGRALAAQAGRASGIFTRLGGSGLSPSPEIQVNSTVAGDQLEPDVALDTEGSSIVVWQDRPNGRIAAQLFERNGERRGAEMDVSATLVAASHPRVAAIGPGRFVVVWLQRTAGQAAPSVWARRVMLPPKRNSRGR